MDSHTLLVFTFPAALILLLFIWTKAKTGGSATRRPPGPTGWPLVGNMFDLGDMPHQTMYKLKAKYGPLLWLQLGSVNTMVVQSPKVAAELFKNYDIPFADRKIPDALTAFHFNESALSMNTFGAYWRVLRRICSKEFSVNKRVNETEDIRRKCTDDMVRWIEEEAAASRANGGPGEVLDLLDTKSTEGKEFFDCMNKIMELAGTPNVADFFPFLKWFDPMKIKRTMVRDMTKTMKIVSKFVKERIEEKQAGTQRAKRDFLDVLLEYEGDGKDGPDKFTVHNVNVIIMDFTSEALPAAVEEVYGKPFAFDWELSGGVTPETMDMQERLGITLRKKVPEDPIEAKEEARPDAHVEEEARPDEQAEEEARLDAQAEEDEARPDG
ncbi:hypothetical protein RHSIM_Rhsim03G0082900 [Rhododendron simsii]|uniref:Cytochrome P450 n=1 Tax=Rhododendron simsii TaxID=118357 RepID=A0A834H708_RHOSS|nr:hypothetical protein RHSIM_Rhsim03G0082900 [Rhododendron simsii]